MMKSLRVTRNLKITLTRSMGTSQKSNSGFSFTGGFPQLPVPDKKRIFDTAKTKVYSYMDSYEEFIGIKQVKEAHSRVIQAELKFMEFQELRRCAHKDLNDIQNKLRDIRSELDRTTRGEDRYLELIKSEINMIREERVLKDRFEDLEKKEREGFNVLSNALRFSHEKERAQTEKTKYWSVIGSVIGATLGILGTTISSQMKMRQLKKLMSENSAENAADVQDKLVAIMNRLDTSISTEKNPNTLTLSEKVMALLNSQDKQQKDFFKKTGELIKMTDSLQERLQIFQQVLPAAYTVPNNYNLSRNKNSMSPDSTLEFIPSSLEKLMDEKEYNTRRDIVIAASIIILLVPWLCIRLSSP